MPVAQKICNIIIKGGTKKANDNGLPENNNNKNSKRIQKYILSDKKRKTKSRQNCRDYKYKEGKSKSLCPEPKKHVNTPKRNFKYDYSIFCG